MKKIKIILSLILFLSSLTIIAQRTEDEFLTGDNGFEEIVPPPGTECIECPNIKDFSFVNSFNALDAAFTNQLLLNTARDKKYREWFNKQKNNIKAELEKKFSKSFDSYDAAKTALFLHSEKNNIVVNAVAPRKKYHDLEFSKRRTQNIYLEEISFLKLRNLEIKSGNLDNSKYGYLQVDGVSLKNIKTLEDLNTKWNTLYDRFRTNYRQKFFYDKVHSNLSLGNLITNFSNQALQLKNLYYTNINDEWEQLNYMQFLINYENIKKFLTPPLYYPKLINLFNKFKGTDQATSPVIESHALSRSSYPSLFRTDYDLTLEIYELLQNPEDLNEATHLKRKEAERLRAEADGLNGLLGGLDTSGYVVKNLIAELDLDINDYIVDNKNHTLSNEEFALIRQKSDFIYSKINTISKESINQLSFTDQQLVVQDILFVIMFPGIKQLHSSNPNLVSDFLNDVVEGEVFVFNKYLKLFQNTPINFSKLWDNYDDIKGTHLKNDNKEDFSNYCAINLSHALLNTGISLNNFKGVKCWGCKNVENNNKHILRAQELANWLKTNVGNINGIENPVFLTGSNFENFIDGKKGIVFFRDYWQRDSDTGTNRTGDHIDLWDGNELAGSTWFWTRFRLNLPWVAERFGSSDLSKSKEVIFWEIKN